MVRLDWVWVVAHVIFVSAFSQIALFALFCLIGTGWNWGIGLDNLLFLKWVAF